MNSSYIENVLPGIAAFIRLRKTRYLDIMCDDSVMAEGKRPIQQMPPPPSAVVPLGKALHPHCIVPQRGQNIVGPSVA